MGDFDNSTPMTPEQVGSGVAELAARAAQRAARPPAGQPPGQPAERRPTGEEMFRQAQQMSRFYNQPAVREPEADDQDDADMGDQGGAPPVTQFSDDLLDDLSDELEGKAKPKAQVKAKGERQVDEDARKRALDRLKIPKALREHLEAADPEQVDAWLGTLVQEQGKTDDALGERDRAVSTLRTELDALKAQIQGGQKGRAATASNAGTRQGDPSLADAGDQDEDLEGLRDADPEVARALEKRDARIKALAAENRKAERRLRELEARHEAEAKVLRREVVQAAITDLQGELAGMYPALNDLNIVRSEVAPRARALLAAGLASDFKSALSQAAHAAFGDMIEADQAARVAQGRAHAPTVARVSDKAQAPRRRESTATKAGEIYLQLKGENPDWTEARVRAEAKRRAGRIVPDKPFISN